VEVKDVPSALLSLVSGDGIFRWWRSALYLFSRFLLRHWGSCRVKFRGGLRLAALARLVGGQKRLLLSFAPPTVHANHNVRRQKAMDCHWRPMSLRKL
jgi:hypothetical protein